MSDAKKGCAGCGCLVVIIVIVAGAVYAYRAVKTGRGIPSLPSSEPAAAVPVSPGTGKSQSVGTRPAANDASTGGGSVPMAVPARRISESERAATARLDDIGELPLAEAILREDAAASSVEKEVVSKIQALPNSSSFLKHLEAMGQYVSEVLVSQKLTQVCDRLEARMRSVEADQAANSSRMSPEGVQRAMQTLNLQQKRLVDLRSKISGLTQKLEAVGLAAEQWNLAYHQYRKISGDAFAQTEVSKDILSFLQNFKTIRPRSAAVPGGRKAEVLPGAAPSRAAKGGASSEEASQSLAQWDEGSPLIIKQVLGIMVMLNPLGRSDQFQEGAQIVAVYAAMPGEQAGLKDGDVITGVNGADIQHKGDLARVCRSLIPGQTVKLKFLRKTGSSLEEKSSELRAHFSRKP